MSSRLDRHFALVPSIRDRVEEINPFDESSSWQQIRALLVEVMLMDRVILSDASKVAIMKAVMEKGGWIR